MSEFAPPPMSNKSSFIDRWTAMPEVHALLSCAQRQRVPIGIRGGVVRNFLLGSLQTERASLLDLIDPFSDIDCVLIDEWDREAIAASLASSFPFFGYHRWEFESLASVESNLQFYGKVPAERLIIWHHGFKDNKPLVTLQELGLSAERIISEPGFPGDFLWHRSSEKTADPWVVVLDALRLKRYALQYPANTSLSEQLFMPDRSTFERLDTIPSRMLLSNLSRFNLAILDIIATAESLPRDDSYLRELWSRLPERMRKADTILSNFFFSESAANPTHIGGLVYRQPRKSLRTRLLSDRNTEHQRYGLQSLIPWTPLWSVQNSDSSCCRHSDFQNGVAVLSWRPTNSNIAFGQDVPFDHAVVAQVHGSEPYGQTGVEQPIILPIPGFVRTGPSVTVRMDHAFPSGYFRQNVRIWVGLVKASED